MAWPHIEANEGAALAKLEVLRGLRLTKFGRLPQWAEERLERADLSQIDRWTKKTLTAQTLEGVIGKK